MTGLSPVGLQSYRLLLPALRSSEVGLQHSDSLQFPVWEIELWSQQRRLRLDPIEHCPSNVALPAPAAKHLVPVALHGSVHPVQRAEISGDTKVGIVSAEYQIEVIHLLLHRQMPHPPHQVLQAHECALQARPFGAHPNPKVAFQIARAIQGEAQKVDCLRTSSPVFARVPLCEATKFNQFGLGRFKGQAELPQSFAQHLLDPKRIRTILETHHKVVDIPHQIGPRLVTVA